MILHGLPYSGLVDVLKNKFLVYLHIKVFTVLIKSTSLHLVSSKTLTCLLFSVTFKYNLKLVEFQGSNKILGRHCIIQVIIAELSRYFMLMIVTLLL